MPNVINCCSDPDCWGCGGSDKLAGSPRTTSVRFTVSSKDHLPELVKVTAVYDWGESAAADFTVRPALTGRPAITGGPQGPGLERLPRIVLAAPQAAKDPCPRHYTGDPELPCRCPR
jgi:hypothetical protein